MTTDRPTTLPPCWAESLLRMMLPPRDRDSVSGDLLEEYRESIAPRRGARANQWYVRQVGWHVLRASWPWAALFAAGFLARSAYDWFVPTTSFQLRSTVTTWYGVATLFAAASWTTWRSRRPLTGVLFAVVISQLAAVLTVVGSLLMLAVWHDAQTMDAIAGSGGLGEQFVLPFMMIVPAMIVGAAGAIVGWLAATLYDASRPKTKSA